MINIIYLQGCSVSISMTEEIDVEMKSCTHGRGLFATRNFKRGEKIATITGGRIDDQWLSKFHTPIERDEGGRFARFWVMNVDSKHWSNYLDNGGYKGENVRFIRFNEVEPRAELVATRDIISGEELLLNYKQIMEHLRDQDLV